MKNGTLWFGTLITVVVSCAAAAFVYRPNQAPPSQAERDAIRARDTDRLRALALIEQGRAAEARNLVRPMIDTPINDYDAVEGNRIMSMSHRRDGDIAAAKASLEAALVAFDASPVLRTKTRWLRARIILDQADIAAFSERDTERAIRLYDQVVAQQASAKKTDVETAATNAAMLCASRGRYVEAVQRGDNLLASEAAAALSTRHVILLRVSQASWLAKHGDLQGAFARYQSIWTDYGQRSEAAVLNAGLSVAAGHPVPRDCASRVAIARALLEKIDAVRRAPVNTETETSASATELNEIEHQTLVVIADSGGCEGEREFVQWARGRLGLRN